jgi:uncharacterized membrane protein
MTVRRISPLSSPTEEGLSVLQVSGSADVSGYRSCFCVQDMSTLGVILFFAVLQSFAQTQTPMCFQVVPLSFLFRQLLSIVLHVVLCFVCSSRSSERTEQCNGNHVVGSELDGLVWQMILCACS